MRLLLSDVSKSSGAIATSATSSLRAGITNYYRRLDIALVVLIIAGISFVAHVIFANNYGYFRDELYFMAMSQHPAFGYVDVPPLVPWITLIPRFLTGNALWALHVISALVCAATIILTGLMARLQREACIFASNYGEAGALLEFGGRYHLPPTISGHNAFYIWGPQGCTGQVLITINVDPAVAARTSCKACVAFENDAPILILRQPKEPFNKLWASAKMYE